MFFKKRVGLHLKWTLIFIILLFISQISTIIVSFSQAINETTNLMEYNLINTSNIIIAMHNIGFNINSNILDFIDQREINLTLISENSPYSPSISIDLLNRLLNGEIILNYTQHMFYRIPRVLFYLDDNLAMLSPMLNNNELNIFINAIGRSALVNMALSSIFLSSALYFIVRRIKKISIAAKEVGKGNFNIELNSNKEDEIDELADSFNIMVSKLKKIDYLKRDFLSSISHEFKTPITAIEGYANLLKSEDISEDKYNEYIDIIIKEISRLSNLSTNLLKIAVLDSSDFISEKKEFYIDEQIRHVILLLENIWGEKGIEFDIEMPALLYNGNEELLSQVFINIIHNAIKFSKKNSEIGVYIKDNEDYILIKIKDNGPGIAEIHIEKIFDKFYRAFGKKTSGNGLGLAIAKRIVELSKGEIWFETEINKGSTFFIKLPK